MRKMETRHRLGSLIVALTGSVLWSSTASAAEPPERCEAAKLKAAGIYAACRLKAEARARLRDEDPDYAACVERFEKKFGKADASAGLGVCPSESDADPIGDEVTAGADEIAHQLAGPDPTCPTGYRDRSPSQVIADFRAAYDAQDWTGIACSYHPEAYVFTDQGLLIGHADIVAWFSSLWTLFGGVSFHVVEESEFGDRVRVIYRLDGGWIVIPDGLDAYHVKRGQIRAQFAHGRIEFTGPPPE